MAWQLDSLINSINTLERSLKAAHSSVDSLSDDLRETVRAGVIQNFEVAYEQCWKFVQRWIKENRTQYSVEHPRTRRELFRIAARYGLVADPSAWFAYGDARNLTSHIYDEIINIMDKHMPECEVRAFGSRVSGRASRFSDLDLVLVGKERLDWRRIEALKDALSESDLPIMVDVLDWKAVSNKFREIIKQNYVVIRNNLEVKKNHEGSSRYSRSIPFHPVSGQAAG